MGANNFSIPELIYFTFFRELHGQNLEEYTIKIMYGTENKGDI